MVTGRCLCWAITATVLATVAGRSFRQPPAGRIASASGYAPISVAASDRGNSNDLSMLDMGSELDKSGQSASMGSEHPLSWLFDRWSHPAAPGPVASPFSAAAFTPAMPGDISTTANDRGAGSLSREAWRAPRPQEPQDKALSLTPAPPMAIAPQLALPADEANDREAGPLPRRTWRAPRPQEPQDEAPTLMPTAPMAAASQPRPEPHWRAPADEVSQMRNEIAELRKEVVNGNKDMWNAVKLITSTVEKDERVMEAVTHDVQMLRGRRGGSVPLVATECSMRQSSCSECLSVPSCVWCKVEQRCYSGDSAGPVRGECAFFKHGTCG